MTAEYRQLADDFFVAPQISPGAVRDAAGDGFKLIVNNRPDGEAPGQPRGEEIEAAAREAGLGYAFIPVGPAGITRGHIDALKSALNEAGQGKTLAFCRSGARSAFVYAYTAAASGRPVHEIVAGAAQAGFDVSAHAGVLEQLNNEATKDDE
ncbi:TIGR01244 family sulfur transferase [Hyphococcus sp.]|uniref:TIGR01244 family sulfur transferase n=1 Tax=Hyphococcus sp. TaxID=2038636 RepID=UPI003CCC09C7